MKLLRIPKMPRFKLRRPTKQPPRKLEARLRASNATTADAYDEEEPQTKLTGALVVVAVLHIVAVGGIYAFNQIKASRRAPELAPIVESKPASAAPKTTSTPVEQPVPAKSAAAPAPVAPVSRQRVHNVKPGDTLTSIAKTFNVSIADLKAANSLSNDVIRPGQILNLPATKLASEAPAAAAKPQETAEPKPATRSYTVKSGDRLVFIAKKLGVSQEDIVAMNKIKDPTKIQVGQTLKVPAKKGN